MDAELKLRPDNFAKFLLHKCQIRLNDDAVVPVDFSAVFEPILLGRRGSDVSAREGEGRAQWDVHLTPEGRRAGRY